MRRGCSHARMVALGTMWESSRQMAIIAIDTAQRMRPPMTTSHDLKSAGLKATVPRLKIINLFETSKVRHLTAEDVYKLLLGRGTRHRPCDGLPRADAVRAGGAARSPSLRVRQGRVRAERGQASRPSRLHAVRARRGVLRRRDREAADQDRHATAGSRSASTRSTCTPTAPSRGARTARSAGRIERAFLAGAVHPLRVAQRVRDANVDVIAGGCHISVSSVGGM